MSNKIIDVVKLITASETLTEVLRTGYVLKGVSNPENISSHSFNVAVLILLLSEKIEDIDSYKCLKIALIHDFPEALVMDTPLISKKYTNKTEAEQKAATDLFESYPDLQKLYIEYQQEKTAESKLVHDCDKLQMYIRASRYHRFNNGDMSEFMSADPNFHFDFCTEILSGFKNLDGKIYIK